MDIEAAELVDTMVLGADSGGLRMSPEEFDAIEEGQYDSAYHYELIHGVVVVNPIPGERQADPNDLLGYLLRDYQERHPQGSALDATLPERYIHLPDSRRQPDRVVWVGLGRRPDPRVDVPAIAIEFVSAGRRNWMRDYVEKRDEYLGIGVQEYWVIDRFRRCMTVYTKEAGGIRETVVPETDIYTTPLLPGFELPLQRLLAASDHW